MRRYLIIAIAILLGLITLIIIDKMAGKDEKEGGIRLAHIAGAVVALITLGVGLYLLETSAASPSGQYVPAKIIDGEIVKPEFVVPEKGATPPVK